MTDDEILPIEEFPTTTILKVEVRMFPTIPHGRDNEITRELVDTVSSAVDSALAEVLIPRKLETNTETRVSVRDVIFEIGSEK